MYYGVYVPNFGAYGDPHNLLALAATAEAAGWDGLFLWDHLQLYRKSDVPVTDAWLALAAIAARTQRLRLGPLITPVPRRRPWKLAREIVSLDVLSRGRAVLGVGLGAPADAEFGCFGEETDDRVRARKLDEGLAIVDRLQREREVCHAGEFHRIEDVSFLPQPVQRPRVPVWVAGFWPNPAPMRRAARWDGVFPLKLPGAPISGLTPQNIDWSGLWMTPAEIGDCAAFVAARRPDGRPFDLVASGATPPGNRRAACGHVAAFEAAGATWWLEWLDEQRGSFEALLAHVRNGPPRP
jgi:hypothetical protein